MTTPSRLEVDAGALKAMAHPVRVRILQVLERRRQASVTSLAEQLGESTGTTSYHLRQLAKHGFVEPFDALDSPDSSGTPDGTEVGDAAAGGASAESARFGPRRGRRQQWWRMAVDEIHTTGFGFLADEATREAAGFVLREYQADRSRRLAHWFATASEWPEAWQRAAGDADGYLRLSPRQTRALVDELAAVVARYRRVRPGKDARTVDVQYAVFPADRQADS